MRHFDFLSADERERLFLRAPEDFDRRAPRDQLGPALGGLLYTPAQRPGLAESLIAKRHLGLTSVALCLEDGVADADLEEAEERCVATLRQLDEAARDGADLPLTFVRVRSPRHLRHVGSRVSRYTAALSGFVLPKFGPRNAAAYLDEVRRLTDGDEPWWVMPVLETPELIHTETRRSTLAEVAAVIDAAGPRVLCVRVGGTDLSGLFGLRRPSDLTVYDLGVIRDCISDVVNVFGRQARGLTISAPVHEHFGTVPDDGAAWLTIPPVEQSTLVREVRLDLANGLVGKTLIHPSQIAPVHLTSVVDEHEWLDAVSITADAGGGAARSASSRGMNEPKPHQEWARRTLRRARAFGVRRGGPAPALAAAAR
ncbi:MAG TPA: HpcH/HpaI aldolase/citrate lyase family protein [Candidatus Dormibacteraeota bacterium]|nr:HpcH/HpaI aldolase/citrate lyase family protein [Candidatus Dormibacteraeota bacterium]